MDAPMSVGGTVVLLRDRSSRGPEILLIRRPESGSFAGGWVFPGGIVEHTDALGDEDEDEQRIAARAAARECEEEAGLRPSELVALSCWVPPAEAPKRVRTWFFLAPAPDGDLLLAPREVMEARWLTSAAALDLHATGELRLFPPTWVTLHALAQTESVADALDRAVAPEFFVTRLIGGGVFAWAGDAEHPEGGGGRHRLDTSVLPWQYVRD